jgi:hypothetical protein
MQTIITAAVGAAIGVAAILLGLRFHMGDWYVDGVWGYIGAALAGALVALIVGAVMRRELGWP